jgi:hypothetical protein
MSQQVRRRKQKTITYEENSKNAELLGRGMVYRELYLKLAGTITITAGDGESANIKPGDEWGVVKKIELIANNTDTLRSISGNQLWWMNYFMYGVPPVITPGLVAAAATSVPFVSTLILPLWMPRSLRPMDTALDARELSDLKLEITWGDVEDIILDAANTPTWAVEPTIQVHSLECYNVSGPFSQWRVYNIQKEISATNAQFQVILPVGPMYRGFILNTTRLVAIGGENVQCDDPAILNNFKMKSGTTIFADVPAAILRQVDSWERSSIINPLDSQVGGAPPVPAYDTLRAGYTANNRGAWYYYDHVTDGYLTESIDTLGFSEFELELDVTVGASTTQINIMPLQIIPVRG